MKKSSRKSILKKAVIASVLSAMICVLTYYLKIPTHNGYMHLGDALIYIGACILPPPFAILSAGIGGMMADCFGGYTMYMLPTFIIKSLLVLPFTYKQKKILNTRNSIAVAICTFITVGGYYLAEVVLVSISSTFSFSDFKSYLFSPIAWTSAFYSIPGNIIQAVGSAIVFFILAAALDKASIKTRINKMMEE